MFPVNYCNDAYPLLSFAYALYCGRNTTETMMGHEASRVRGSIRALPGFQAWPPNVAQVQDPAVYRDYFTYYTMSQTREFPAAAIQIVAEQVPTNGLPEWSAMKDLTMPNRAQCMAYLAIMMRELTGQGVAPNPLPPVQARPPRKNAARDDAHPLLSCVAVIFLNDDTNLPANPATFLADYEISQSSAQALAAYGGRLAAAGGPIGAGGPWLTQAEATTLNTELSLEMSTNQFIW